jgi:hypothetical protein
MMTSKATDDVMRAARDLVHDYMADHNGRAAQNPAVERLAAALASHDRQARGARAPEWIAKEKGDDERD